MAAEIRIKQEKKFLKKCLNIWDIIELRKNSCTNINGDKSNGLIGIHDNFFRIDPDFLNPTDNNYSIRNKKNKKSNAFCLFDRLNLNRGIGLTFDKNDILLRLNYPSTQSEIRSFYALIQNICIKINESKFYRTEYEGENSISIAEIEELYKLDYFGSYNTLKQVYFEGGDKRVNLFEVTNPITITKNNYYDSNHIIISYTDKDTDGLINKLELQKN